MAASTPPESPSMIDRSIQLDEDFVFQNDYCRQSHWKISAFEWLYNEVYGMLSKYQGLPFAADYSPQSLAQLMWELLSKFMAKLNELKEQVVERNNSIAEHEEKHERAKTLRSIEHENFLIERRKNWQLQDEVSNLNAKLDGALEKIKVLENADSANLLEEANLREQAAASNVMIENLGYELNLQRKKNEKLELALRALEGVRSQRDASLDAEVLERVIGDALNQSMESNASSRSLSPQECNEVVRELTQNMKDALARQGGWIRNLKEEIRNQTLEEDRLKAENWQMTEKIHQLVSDKENKQNLIRIYEEELGPYDRQIREWEEYVENIREPIIEKQPRDPNMPNAGNQFSPEKPDDGEFLELQVLDQASLVRVSHQSPIRASTPQNQPGDTDSQPIPIITLPQSPIRSSTPQDQQVTSFSRSIAPDLQENAVSLSWEDMEFSVDSLEGQSPRSPIVTQDEDSSSSTSAIFEDTYLFDVSMQFVDYTLSDTPPSTGSRSPSDQSPLSPSGIAFQPSADLYPPLTYQSPISPSMLSYWPEGEMNPSDIFSPLSGQSRQRPEVKPPVRVSTPYNPSPATKGVVQHLQQIGYQPSGSNYSPLRTISPRWMNQDENVLPPNGQSPRSPTAIQDENPSSQFAINVTPVVFPKSRFRYTDLRKEIFNRRPSPTLKQNIDIQPGPVIRTASSEHIASDIAQNLPDPSKNSLNRVPKPPGKMRVKRKLIRQGSQPAVTSGTIPVTPSTTRDYPVSPISVLARGHFGRRNLYGTDKLPYTYRPKLNQSIEWETVSPKFEASPLDDIIDWDDSNESTRSNRSPDKSREFHRSSNKSPQLNVISERSPQLNITSERSPQLNITSERSPQLIISPDRPPQLNITSERSPQLNITSERSPQLNITSERSPQLSSTSGISSKWNPGVSERVARQMRSLIESYPRDYRPQRPGESDLEYMIATTSKGERIERLIRLSTSEGRRLMKSFIPPPGRKGITYPARGITPHFAGSRIPRFVGGMLPPQTNSPSITTPQLNTTSESPIQMPEILESHPYAEVFRDLITNYGSGKKK